MSSNTCHPPPGDASSAPPPGPIIRPSGSNCSGANGASRKSSSLASTRSAACRTKRQCLTSPRNSSRLPERPQAARARPLQVLPRNLQRARGERARAGLMARETRSAAPGRHRNRKAAAIPGRDRVLTVRGQTTRRPASGSRAAGEHGSRVAAAPRRVAADRIAPVRKRRARR